MDVWASPLCPLEERERGMWWGCSLAVPFVKDWLENILTASQVPVTMFIHPQVCQEVGIRPHGTQDQWHWYRKTVDTSCLIPAVNITPESWITQMLLSRLLRVLVRNQVYCGIRIVLHIWKMVRNVNSLIGQNTDCYLIPTWHSPFWTEKWDSVKLFKYWLLCHGDWWVLRALSHLQLFWYVNPFIGSYLLVFYSSWSKGS